jgi:hypothetical protein
MCPVQLPLAATGCDQGCFFPLSLSHSHRRDNILILFVYYIISVALCTSLSCASLVCSQFIVQSIRGQDQGNTTVHYYFETHTQASCPLYFSIMLLSLEVATAQMAWVRSRVWEVRSVATVTQASVQREISYRCPLGSGTRQRQVSRGAQRCGTLGNAKRGPLWLYSDRGRKGFRMPPQVAKLRRNDRLYRGCVALESLRVHASAAGSGTRTKGCTDLRSTGPGFFSILKVVKTGNMYKDRVMVHLLE